MEFRYEVNGEIHTVRVEREGEGRYRVTVGDRTYAVEAHRPEHGRLHLSIEGRRCRAYVAREGARRYVAFGARPYVLEQSRGRRRARAAAHEGSLEAQMPGQVVAVLVEEGQEVEAGQTLVVLEAMKMELRVIAPTAGRVRAVFCQPGDVVERGQQLVELA